MDQDSSVTGPHLSPEEMAAYLDRRPEMPGRIRLETHLAHCEACLADVIAVVRVLRAWKVGTRARRAARDRAAARLCEHPVSGASRFDPAPLDASEPPPT
jgi:anti-sigma factor RsiW